MRARRQSTSALGVVALAAMALTAASAGPGRGAAVGDTGVRERDPGVPVAFRQVTGCSTTTPSSGPATGAPEAVARDFRSLTGRLPSGRVGLAYAAPGGQATVLLGDLDQGPAWSTIKVPLSMAALQAHPSSTTAGLVHRAITESDNAAAMALWSSLGGGTAAAGAVDEVLTANESGRTSTQARVVRPGYSPFGQTVWALADQVHFMASLACKAPNDAVLQEMGDIAPAQRWGLGRIPGARFKGGWGPDPSGRYLVRQFGLVPSGGSQLAVAVAAEPGSGTFQEGTAVLDEVAGWLVQSGQLTS